jgi:hypothetical protein
MPMRIISKQWAATISLTMHHNHFCPSSLFWIYSTRYALSLTIFPHYLIILHGRNSNHIIYLPEVWCSPALHPSVHDRFFVLANIKQSNMHTKHKVALARKFNYMNPTMNYDNRLQFTPVNIHITTHTNSTKYKYIITYRSPKASSQSEIATCQDFWLSHLPLLCSSYYALLLTLRTHWHKTFQSSLSAVTRVTAKCSIS